MAEGGVRPSAIAGRWYPGDAGALRREVEGFLAQVAPVELPGPLLGLIVPHAGYAYSGPSAARAFAQVRGGRKVFRPYRRVVLLGPLHRPIWGSRLGSFMAPDATAYRTPLGDVPIDREFLQALDAAVGLTTVHGDEEHALEIELPFLQVALGDFLLVPIMMGDHIADPHAAERAGRLAAAVAGRLKIENGRLKIGTGEPGALPAAASGTGDRGTLLVASTDLSHLEDYGAVRRTDERLVDLVNALDVDGLQKALQHGTVQACGAMGLVTVLEACRLLGARGASVLEYTTSGDVTGQRAPGVYTVGYLAAAIYG